MRTTKIPRMTIGLLTALALAGISAQAQEPQYSNDPVSQDKKAIHDKHVRASKLIGKEVKNNQDERLGTINDLILSDKNSVQFAVLSVGGALGVGDSKIAVPINDLNCSGEAIRLSATKEELKNIAKTPTGDWAFVSGEEWTQDIDGFYGRPMKTASSTGVSQGYTTTTTTTDNSVNRDAYVVRDSQGFITSPDYRYERESIDTTKVREPVRATQGDGAKELTRRYSKTTSDEWYPAGTTTTTTTTTTARTADGRMRDSVNQTLRDDYGTSTARAINVTVVDGIVTLNGTVSTEAEKQHIESRVKSMSGVYRVNNQLSVRD